VSAPALATRIGPNAIIQVAAALRAHLGDATAAPLLEGATGYRLDTLPTAMVDEREVQSLMRAVVGHLGPAEAAPLLRDAGRRTADYLLANRIPRIVQPLIRALPPRLGLAVLLAAVSRHAWTFAGSGRFRIVPNGDWPDLVFEECAICRGMQEARRVCDYYAGTFEGLFVRLIGRDLRVVECECIAQGGATCRFRVERVALN